MKYPPRHEDIPAVVTQAQVDELAREVARLQSRLAKMKLKLKKQRKPGDGQV